MKPFKNLVTSVIRQWNYTRGETIEILTSLTNEQLKFKPNGSDKWQPLYFQFACMGRTQIVYAKAIIEGKMDYSWFEAEDLPRKNDYKTKEQLLDLLKQADEEWLNAIRERRREEEFEVAWPGFKQSLLNHIPSLMAHERIHHGQLISYLTLAGIELPEKFKSNWAL